MVKKHQLKSFRLPHSLAVRLRRAADKKSWSQTMVVKEALEEYLKKVGT